LEALVLPTQGGPVTIIYLVDLMICFSN
jgi:hypothetical protein